MKKRDLVAQDGGDVSNRSRDYLTQSKYSAFSSFSGISELLHQIVRKHNSLPVNVSEEYTAKCAVS